MTGIQNLASLFGSPNSVAETEAASGPAEAKGGATTAADTGNRSLLDTDRSIVSNAGGAMLKAMNTSDVRTDRVAALKATINSGTYSVSSQDVAQKLVASMLGQGS